MDIYDPKGSRNQSFKIPVVPVQLASLKCSLYQFSFKLKSFVFWDNIGPNR